MLSSTSDAATGDDQAIFCSSFVANEKASWANGKVLAKWASQNPGERDRWSAWASSICAGSPSATPAMTTQHGLTLIAAGQMALPEPPPTTTTTTTTTQPTTTTTQTTTTTTTTPPPGCTQTISSGLQAAIQSAAAGSTLCLNSGSYGSLSLSGVSKASQVTVQPVSGASVTLGSVSLNNVNHLTLTGLGGTLSIAGGGIDSSTGASSHITFAHVRWTSDFLIRTRGNGDQAILVDHSTFDGISQGLYEGRLTVFGHNAPAPSGVVISNSHFGNGGCSDGIQLTGGANGVQIGPGNEFEDIVQGSCTAHSDAIQPYDSRNTLIVGNYIHDTSTQIMAPDDAADPVTIRDNVIVGSGYPWLVVAGGSTNWVINHNTFLRSAVAFNKSNQGTNPGGNVVTNNVFANGANIVGSGYTADHNLMSGAVFVGGANPTSYAGYKLAAGSPGKGAASDGSDMGIH